MPDTPDLPPEPEKPLDNDCCGAACDPCIWDVYYQRLQDWKMQKAAIEAKNSPLNSPRPE